MSDFLPPDYKVPESEGSYMKLAQGDNRFRVLGKAIVGNEYWVTFMSEGKEVRKPKRVRMDTIIPVGEVEGSVKHFWAMPVFNYDSSKIQILTLTQKGLQKAITALVQNKKWGSPENYNLIINRVGEGLETEYMVTPEPTDEDEEKMIAEIKKEYEEMGIQMNNLYISAEFPYGGDPFQKQEVEMTDEEVEKINQSLNS